jgi:hypothetical protein
MKRASNEYRLNLIREVALRKQSQHADDSMAKHIRDLLSHQPNTENHVEHNKHFAGCHYDEGIGGWISDKWDSTK